MAQVFQTQVLNLVVEGVFDRFPNLRMALIEGGWTWLPSLMWRIDKDWKGLRREVPWNTRVPSEYIRERIRLSLAADRRAARSEAPAARSIEQTRLRRPADVLDRLPALALPMRPSRRVPVGLA